MANERRAHPVVSFKSKKKMPCPLFELSNKVIENGVEVRYFWASYYISRFNFVLVHLFTVFYWFPFLFNNPLKFPLVNTLDSSKGTSDPTCVPDWDYDALKSNILLWFFIWWLPHSGLSRRVVKQALGLWNHPIDRPLFGIVACVGISIWTHFWRPITTCGHFDVLTVNPVILVISGVVIGFSLFLILGFFWAMPDHVFGTSRHRILKNPPKHALFLKFPYSMVRHPAASGFIWMFWALPSWTPNHLLYATLWTIFIVVGTNFEEGGLRSSDEFGLSYSKYAAQVGMFFPKVRWFLGKEVRL